MAGAGIGMKDGLSPFLFLDLGHGYDFAAKDHTTLASTGLGFDYTIGANLAASLTGAVALAVRPPSCRLEFCTRRCQTWGWV